MGAEPLPARIRVHQQDPGRAGRAVGGFAADGVRAWLALLGEVLGDGSSDGSADGSGDVPGDPTAVLALLSGALLDLLATGDVERTTTAVRDRVAMLTPGVTVTPGRG